MNWKVGAFLEAKSGVPGEFWYERAMDNKDAYAADASYVTQPKVKAWETQEVVNRIGEIVSRITKRELKMKPKQPEKTKKGSEGEEKESRDSGSTNRPLGIARENFLVGEAELTPPTTDIYTRCTIENDHRQQRHRPSSRQQEL